MFSTYVLRVRPCPSPVPGGRGCETTPAHRDGVGVMVARWNQGSWDPHPPVTGSLPFIFSKIFHSQIVRLDSDFNPSTLKKPIK